MVKLVSHVADFVHNKSSFPLLVYILSLLLAYYDWPFVLLI